MISDLFCFVDAIIIITYFYDVVDNLSRFEQEEHTVVTTLPAVITMGQRTLSGAADTRPVVLVSQGMHLAATTRELSVWFRVRGKKMHPYVPYLLERGTMPHLILRCWEPPKPQFDLVQHSASNPSFARLSRRSRSTHFGGLPVPWSPPHRITGSRRHRPHLCRYRDSPA